MSKFKIGDRVRCIKGYEDSRDTPHTGWTGTVYDAYEYGAAAEWDQVGKRQRYLSDCVVDDRLELITDTDAGADNTDTIHRIEQIVDERFAKLDAAIAHLRSLIEKPAQEPAPDKPKEERRCTDADMRPGLRVRTPEGWVGEVLMKDENWEHPYRVSEGWGMRWTIGYADDFTIVDE